MRKILFLVLMAFGARLQVYAQDFALVNYRNDDGLFNEITKSIVQDRSNFVWIATDAGVARFDGKNFNYYDIFESNYIKHLSYQKDTIWVVSDAGLFYLKNQIDTVLVQKVIGVSPDRTNTALVSPRNLFIDSKNRFWISETSSISRLVGKKIKRYNLGSKTQSNHIAKSFNFVEYKGRVFACSQTGYLFEYKLEKDRFEEINLGSIIGDVWAIHLVNDKIWLGSVKGIMEFDIEAQKTSLKYSIKNASAFRQFDQYTCLIGTFEDGLYIIRKQHIENIRTNLGHINDIFVKDHAAWLSGDRGIGHLKGNLFGNIKNISNSDYVRSVCQADDSTLYALSDASVYRISISPKPENYLIRKIETVYSFSTDEIPYWISSNSRNFVVSTRKGNLHFFDPKFRLQKSLNISERNIPYFWLEKNGEIWACGDKLYRVFANKKIKVYGVKEGITKETWIIKRTPQGELVAGSFSIDKSEASYLAVYDSVKDVFRAGFRASHFMNDFWINGQKTIAVGVSKITFSDQTGTQEQSIASKSLNSIAYDSHSETIWAGSNDGLFRYKNKSVSHYDEIHGLGSRLIRGRALLLDKQNRLWIPTSGGLSYTLSDSIALRAEKPILLGVKVDNQPHFLNETMVFPYQSNINFTYISPFFPNKYIHYQYRIIGLNANWSAVNTHTELTMNRLSYGKYTLEIRASIDKSLQTWTEPLQVDFVIEKPWWATWTAIVLACLIFGFSVWLITFFNAQRLKKQNHALERMVNSRTKEIIEQNQNLEEQKQELFRQAEEILQQRDHLQKSYEHIQILSDIGKNITSNLDLNTILLMVYENINTLLNASVFGVGIYKPDQNCIFFELVIENGLKCVPHSRDMSDKSLFAVWCIDHKKEVFINNLEEEYETYLQKYEKDEKELEDGTKSKQVFSLIYLPLMIEEDILGILTVQAFVPQAYSTQDLNILRTLGSYIAVALKNAQAYRQIAEQQEKITESNAELNQMNEELQQQQEELLVLNETLENRNETLATTYARLKRTTEALENSIRYASHIQEVIMPEESDFGKFFSDWFVFYKPKDVVSGDFYWFSQVNAQSGVFALSDCTGHGVPGAFMSMLGATLLHETVNVKQVHNDPSRILRNLHSGLQKILKQTESKNNDGMDISVCYFEKLENQTYRLIFAGAKTTMFYVSENQLFELHGDRQFVGGKLKLKQNFTNQEIILSKDTQIYLFSDGFADQNNSERKKLSSKTFKNVILEISAFSFLEQKEKLTNILDAHQGSEYQRDDITIVGLRI